jgi:4-hydroxybenzoate polyprenyltransferase
MKKWGIFIQERFEPVSHAVLIFFIFAASSLLAMGVEGRVPFFRADFLPALIVITLMFFHLRLFDEIKDYDTDIKVNPGRPLPRGLISLKAFKRVTFAVIVTEILICVLFLPLWSLAAAVLMIGYSLLMFKEFFIGTWLSPKMELYAVTHTIVSGFMTLFIASTVVEKYVWELSWPFFSIAIVNWMNFNIFEFARKTFAGEEERENVDSYSRRLKPFGAVCLVLGNMAVALGFLSVVIRLPGFYGGSNIIVAEGIVAAFLALTGAFYFVKKNSFAAKVYRGTATLYLVFFNALVAGIMIYN